MWAMDGLANFVPYAGLPLMLFVPAAFVVRRRAVTLLVAVPLAIWALLMLTPNAFLALPQEPLPDATQLRVVTANVLMSNEELAALVDDVLAEDPDIVVFQELRHDLADVAPGIAAAYPFRLSTSAPWVTVASRYPLSDTRQIEVAGDERGRDLLTATVDVDGQRVTLVAGHLMPPLDGEKFTITRGQHAALHAAVGEVSGPLLVVGDFNATSLSPTFAGLLWSTGLRIASADRTPTSTYSAFGLGVRIDHVLVREVNVTGERVFDLTGSDHRGVAVDVALPPSAAGTAARQ